MSRTITCENCGTEMTRDRWILSNEYDNGARYRRVFHTDAHCQMIQAQRRSLQNADRITEEGRQRQIALSEEMRERKNNAVIVDDLDLLNEYFERYDAIDRDTVKRREAQNFIDHAEVMRLTAIYKQEQAAFRARLRQSASN